LEWVAVWGSANDPVGRGRIEELRRAGARDRGLTATFHVPATGADDPPAKILVEIEGSLVGTPRGMCLIRLIDARIRPGPRGPLARLSVSNEFEFR
jgi:hypothetical protein